MKGNKKLLIVAVLLLLIAVSYGTYAIYKSTATADASIDTAAWVVTVNNQALTEATHTFTLGNITWATPTVSKVSGKIAPGDHGTVDIVIDGDGSEVDLYYEITIGDLKEGNNTVTNNHLTAVAASGSSLTGTIPYSATAGEMEHTVTLNVQWTAEDDATANGQNEIDMDTAGKSLTLPVTVMVRQNPTGIQP